VDLLIGASYELLCGWQIKLFPGLPLIQKTRQDLVVSEGYCLSHGSSLMSSHDLPFARKVNSLVGLDDLVRRFGEWKATRSQLYELQSKS